jgi:hypothetical protein
MSKIAAIALRGFLVRAPTYISTEHFYFKVTDKSSKLVFGAVILALSVTLARQQVIGSPPAETSFFSFAGAFGIIVSALGILSIFVDKIPQVGTMVADALASVFYLAGAIVGRPP